MAQWADCNLLISELKDHENYKENTDSLILELRRKGLLHDDVSGGTVSERAETLAAYLNRVASNDCSESFHNSLLEVLETFPAFKDMAVKYRTSTELTKPQPATNTGGSVIRYMATLKIESNIDSSLISKHEKNLERFILVGGKKHECNEAGTNGNFPQEESQIIMGGLNSRINALTRKLDNIRLQKDSEVKCLKCKLNATEQRIRAEHAEQLIAQQKRRHQIEISALRNEVQQLSEKIKELESELDDAQQNLQLEEEIVEKTREKVATLHRRVRELELEKEANSSQGRSEK